jgi:HEAT repeat protein
MTIDWNFEADVPTTDFFEARDLDQPEAVVEALEDFVWRMTEDQFRTWEAVIRQEQGLNNTLFLDELADDLLDFDTDHADDRVLYINDIPRYSEPWYAILRQLAPRLLLEPSERLPDDAIKQAITHPDPVVREMASEYFADSFSPDPTIAPWVMQAIERYGSHGAFSSYFFLCQLTHTAETVAWMVRQLQQIGRPDDDTEDYCMGLTIALSMVAPHLIGPHRREIEELQRIAPDVHGMTLARVTTEQLSSDELWKRFEGFVAEPFDEYPEFPETEVLKDIAGQLRDDPRMVSWVFDTLARNVDDPEYSVWREGVAVQLAGELRLSAAVPRLVTLLHDTEEGLNEDTIESLAQIGTDEVVAQLDRRYRTADHGFRRRAAAVLQVIHTDRSIATLRFWYQNEADRAVRHRILRALLCSYVPVAVEPAREAVSSDAPTPAFANLRMELVAFCTLTGTNFPELETWKEEARRDYLDAISGTGDEDDWDDERWEEEEEWDDEDVGDDASDIDLGWDAPRFPGLGQDDDERDERSGRIIHTGPRIGRNDPCPCGSGKKYKKCCLRK